MWDRNVTFGNVQAIWNSAGTRILKYTIEIAHNGLHDHKLISAPDEDILQSKIDMQMRKWQDKWEVFVQKRQAAEEVEASIEEANRRTEEADMELQDIENLLIHTLTTNDAVDWDTLKKKDTFPKSSPIKPIHGEKREYPNLPEEKTPKFTILDKIFKSKKQQKVIHYNAINAAMILKWEEEKQLIEDHNSLIEREYEEKLKHWEVEVQDWENDRNTFISEQDEYNKKIDELKQMYFSLHPDSIVEYCDMVLNNSMYPGAFPKNYELEYNPENKILIIEYQLPSIECFPTLKEVKYMTSKKELKEFYISDSQKLKMFDESMYKISLRTIHEIFESDVANAIDAVSFNGWVESINKATGKEENNCILSIQTNKIEFNEIDLSNVDPKICFKNLKGVASSKLSTLTPIQPILQISRDDKRFVESHTVVGSLDNTTNLAAMDWEEFEHLIRELFEKEFQTNGGEVKVTQASRDGGVDAIAFDPDPIRGGKIIIQAKRYTNTVSVSAVRDLYGSVVNEGATKGILVSTADYGPDAYEFAKAKPLTLLNGSNLLHLLEKHGHHARIDLREAKKILAEK